MSVLSRAICLAFMAAVFLLPLDPGAALGAQTGQTPAQQLKKLENDFNALCKDSKRGGLRDNWLKLEKSLSTLSAKSSGETAAKAAFYAARSWEELGARSFNRSDHTRAVEAYAALAKKYPNSSVVPAAMYRRASVLGLRLKDVTTARQVLAVLQKSFPKSQEAKDAPALEKKFSPAAGSAQSGGAKPAQSASAGKGGAPDVLEQLGLTVKTIMLDAGHGGKDPGCKANGLVEKDFTLAMAKRIGKLLEKKGFKVLYTRTNDTFVTLQGRPDLANDKKADLFISIHLNANTKNSIHGLETYYLNPATSSAAEKVAARENGVSAEELSNVQFILSDLMRDSKVTESRALAGCVQGSILSSLKKSKLTIFDHGVRPAPFYVLMGARMPAVLIEFGYATNAQDAAKLKNETFLQRQAEGVVEGILAYQKELEKKTR